MTISNCCAAPFYEPGYPDNDICSKCYEHAEPMEEDETSANVTEMPVSEITKDDFDSFESIRTYGRWNMFDPRAIEASGLGKVVYLAVMKEYSELKEKYYGKIDECASVSNRA